MRGFRSLVLAGVFSVFVTSTLEAKSCAAIFALSLSLSTSTTAEVISSDTLARDRILFEPSTYHRDPNGLIDFREPASWLFDSSSSYLYSSNADYFPSSFMIRREREMSRESMPEEARWSGYWVDYSQEGNAPNVYSYTVFDYWSDRVSYVQWVHRNPISGPRPIILEDGYYYGRNPIPSPGALSLMMLAGFAQLRRPTR